MIGKTRPRILFVTAHCPHGPVYGAQLRSLNIARILKDCGDLGIVMIPFAPIARECLVKTEKEFNVRGIFSFSEEAPRSLGARLVREIDPGCPDTEGVRLGPDDRAAFNTLVEEYDLIWFQGVAIPNCLGRRKWPCSVLDIDDVPSQYFMGRFREEKSLGSRLRAARKVVLWKRRERVLLERFSIVGVCSEDDQRFLGGGERIHIIPNGFESPAEMPSRRPAEPPRLGFIGTLRYAPNLDGIQWFVRRVWPLILAKRPDARLRLVGTGTDAGISEKQPNVEGLGFVDDSAGEISSWLLTIVPILVGGGTRIKIAEAFSRRCPVVSTTQGAYGYTVQSGDECLLADTPESFASACLSLIENPALGDAMADRARAKFDRELDWKAIAPRVKMAVNSCLTHQSGTGIEH